MMSANRVSDLTIDEFLGLIRTAVREVLHEEAQAPRNQQGILSIPPLQVDPNHPALHIGSRADLYEGDDR